MCLFSLQVYNARRACRTCHIGCAVADNQVGIPIRLAVAEHGEHLSCDRSIRNISSDLIDALNLHRLGHANDEVTRRERNHGLPLV